MSVAKRNRAIQISLNETFNNAKCASTKQFFSSVSVYHKYRRKKWVDLGYHQIENVS